MMEILSLDGLEQCEDDIFQLMQDQVTNFYRGALARENTVFVLCILG